MPKIYNRGPLTVTVPDTLPGSITAACPTGCAPYDARLVGRETATGKEVDIVGTIATVTATFAAVNAGTYTVGVSWKDDRAAGDPRSIPTYGLSKGWEDPGTTAVKSLPKYDQNATYSFILKV